MKERVPGQEEDQSGPGERLWERTVRHVNLTKRMLCIAVQGGPKSCTFSTHHIFGTVYDKMKQISPKCF